MPFDFTQILIIGLILLLFAKDLVKPILVKLGWIKNGNEKKVTEQLENIESNHLEHLEKGIVELQITSNKILDTLEEFREYGIKIRK